MMIPLFLAALAAVATAQSTTTTSCSESSATSCSESTATVVRCTTSYSEFPLATGVPVPTGFFTTTFTSNYSITSTTQSTITVTPAASTFYDVVNTTTTETTISISTPAATTIPTPAGFFPVLKGGAAAIPGPTATAAALSRHRRASSLQSRARQLDLLRRDPMTPVGNTVGYIVDEDGEGQDLRRIFPVYVECQVSVNVNRTSTTVVTGDPVTSVLVPATATAMSTVTFTTTETIVSVAAQPTEYAACQANNVVNNVIGDNNQPIYFDRFIFANPEGFPIMNTLVVNTTSAVNCCIACQRTAFCAGTFYVPTRRECHILLTQAAPTSSVPSLPGPSSTGAPFPFPSSNTSLPYPTASGAPYPAGNGSAFAFPTASGVVLLSTAIPVATPIIAEEDGGMSIQPVTEAPLTGTFDRPGAGTCSAGSMSIFLGKAYGREGFDPRKALVISNGPCGREGVDYDQVAAVPREQLAALGAGSLTSSSS